MSHNSRHPFVRGGDPLSRGSVGSQPLPTVACVQAPAVAEGTIVLLTLHRHAKWWDDDYLVCG